MLKDTHFHAVYLFPFKKFLIGKLVRLGWNKTNFFTGKSWFGMLLLTVNKTATMYWGFPCDSAVKNPPANTEDMGSIPGFRRSPEKGHSNPFQYSCLENPMDRGAWQARVHRVAKSQTWLKHLACTQAALKCQACSSQLTLQSSYDVGSYHQLRGETIKV